MNWFIDTEFDENGKTIELISIALVSEDGREYHAVSSEFDPEACNDWVKANVLPRLPLKGRKTRAEIKTEVAALLLAGGVKPKIWGYYADYDWVVFCQLFGRMVDLPDGMPMLCHDIVQEMSRLGVKRADLPANDGAHDALEDARWIKATWSQLNRRQ